MRLEKKQLEPHDLTLRALTASDKEIVCIWITSPFVVHYSLVVAGPHSTAGKMRKKKYAEQYFNMLISDAQRQSYAILWRKNIIGTVGIKNINNGSADCFIDIGEDNFRGRGLGYLAMTQLLNKAFFIGGLNSIFLDVLEFNRAALKLYYNLGFESQNCWTWHYDEFGIYWRVLRMSIAKRTWLERSL